jgi:DNA modification methylase
MCDCLSSSHLRLQEKRRKPGWGNPDDKEKIGNNLASKQRPEPRKNPHPTVKPLKLMSYLITMGSREGDIVLDPFCGTATTCIAAMMLKRDYVGVEISKEYHEIALKRLECFRRKKAA